MGFFTILCTLSLIVISIDSLPTRNFKPDFPIIEASETRVDINSAVINKSNDDKNVRRNEEHSDLARTRIRDGMTVTSYVVDIETNVGDGTFSGQVLTRVDVTAATREDPIRFLAEDLEITSVQFSLTATSNLRDVDGFSLESDDGEGFLEINTGINMLSYHFLIRFQGTLGSLEGFYIGHYGDGESYVAMNLHPTHARRVFPCIDDPDEAATLTMTFNGLPYSELFGNTALEGDSTSQFNPTIVSPHLWGMIAHDFPILNIPVPNEVALYGRPDNNIENHASLAINYIFNYLNDWTGMSYDSFGNQAGMMRVVALPDVSTSWNSISIVGLWEPYIFMEQRSIKHSIIALEQIAEAMARQWFGFAIFPDNWIHEWIIAGLRTTVAYDALKNFQTNEENPDDNTLLDFDTLFMANIFQESLLQDGHAAALPLRPNEEIYSERDVRQHMNGLMQYKAPAILSMLKVILGERDYINEATQDIISNWLMQPVATETFIFTLSDYYDGNMIGNLEDWFQPYLNHNGYAVVNVVPSANRVVLTQSRFSFSPDQVQHMYEIPISFTTSMDTNFEDYTPQMMLGNVAENMNFVLREENDWVIINIQGRGYYRVNYHPDLWERIIRALENPEERQRIHPLNRATLLDDALNMARAGELNFEIALRIVLTMEHETEYAPWKAFVRNMEFLKKRLIGYFRSNDDLDQDVYLRLLGRFLASIEGELGFSPDPNAIEPAMTSLTRGMVMEHACKANYEPCIAAAAEWFYSDETDEPSVNPDIPPDLRPAVYCSMVREGDENVITALNNRLEDSISMYERLIILESMACSSDEGFIAEYLADTIASDSPYSVEEKFRIFKAIAESSHENANRALRFLTAETDAIRANYGGSTRLEAVIFEIVDVIVDRDMSNRFSDWADSRYSDLDDSADAARRAREIVRENLSFVNNRLRDAYEWMYENNATKTAMSLLLLLITFGVTLFNH